VKIVHKLSGIWREPILHFLVIGALVFLAFELSQGDSVIEQNHIRIDVGTQEQLQAQFNRSRLRQPTDAELSKLIDNHIRDEVYYREARALGLDQNDTVVRKRMFQKLDFLLEELTEEEIPNDEMLVQFIELNASRFREEPYISFIQVFFNPGNDPELISNLARKTLVKLNNGAAPETEGDLAFEQQAYSGVTPSDIKRVFGTAFSGQINALEPNGWVGPVKSVYGIHLVKIIKKTEGGMPLLSDIRKRAIREYKADRRNDLRDIAYKKMRDRYTITIDSTGKITTP